MEQKEQRQLKVKIGLWTSQPYTGRKQAEKTTPLQLLTNFYVKGRITQGGAKSFEESLSGSRAEL